MTETTFETTAAPEMTLPEASPEIPLNSIDLNALWVVKRLRTKGFEAHLTGGCVRDLLLNKKPKDFDVATNAKPEELRQIFRNCRLIGRRFLLAHIFFPGGKIIETATFRANPIDVQEDLPEDLLVTQDNVFGNVEQDAKRRDFTINGLFYDPIEGKVIDYVGGRKDLDAKLIRSIGDPEIRFREDPVRILRAIKFASRLGFKIEENTLSAMKNHASEILRCAPSRVQEELVRLLTSGSATSAIELCRSIGILEQLMPELAEALHSELKTAEGQELSKQDREAHFKGILDALDSVVQRDTDVSPAVAFAALLFPAYAALEQSDQNERNWIDKLCINWADRIRLARNDQDRIRLLLTAIHLLAPAKLEQKSGQYIVRKPWFREALLLFILELTSKAQPLEIVAKWKSLALSHGKPYRQERRSMRGLRPRFSKRRPMRRGRPMPRRQG